MRTSRKHIKEIVLYALSLCRGKWTQSKEIKDYISEKIGQTIASNSIGWHLKELILEGQVERRRAYPGKGKTIYEYRTDLPPQCCEYSEYSKDIPGMCISCSEPWIK